MPVNCSALPENLLESELFGHRRGSFTGAISDKKGLFEEADGGTIFLDEVGSMSAMLQSRLLRVLQEREVRRVGENTPIYVNVRVVAASNEPLEKRIKEGTFREDLYYRLNVIAIPLPSLRERRDDIPLLVAHFLKGKAHPGTNRPDPDDTPGDGGALRLRLAGERAGAGKRHRAGRGVVRGWHYPGSGSAAQPAGQRQDDHSGTGGAGGSSHCPIVPESALYPLHPTDGLGAPLEAGPKTTEPVLPLKAFLRDQEQAYLNRAIQQCGGNKEQAALLLGISVATLYRRLGSEDKEA